MGDRPCGAENGATGALAFGATWVEGEEQEQRVVPCTTRGAAPRPARGAPQRRSKRPSLTTFYSTSGRLAPSIQPQGTLCRAQPCRAAQKAPEHELSEKRGL